MPSAFAGESGRGAKLDLLKICWMFCNSAEKVARKSDDEKMEDMTVSSPEIVPQRQDY